MTIIETGNLVILTDPVFRLLGLFRAAPREYTLDRLPHADLILVSHRHLDHWDPWTMRRLPKEVPLVVRPRRIADDARQLGFTTVHPLAPGETIREKGLTITGTRAVHPGGEVGFVVHGENRDETVYFAGDTSFDSKVFAEIGDRFDLDAALLPIGGLRFLGSGSAQMGPAQAVRALELLRPRVVVGIHWGCAPRVPPLFDMPGTPHDLAGLVEKAGLDVDVRGLRPLEPVNV
jgi:L-ascorbate metabolism protein UlaG (beta-lactamase superfamily)